MAFQKITEQTSHYRQLEKMSVGDLLRNINQEDMTVPMAVEKPSPD
jgi:N-acetylmuramic acid 6-phosphate etherase